MSEASPPNVTQLLVAWGKGDQDAFNALMPEVRKKLPWSCGTATDGNPKTIGDPKWLPLLPTPPYSDYTSGANNLTGAMTRTLEHLFGDQTTFSVFSTPVGMTKTYNRFSDMADDVVVVRIYQGIHFRSADEAARRQGIRSADWAVSHFLKPAN